MRTWPVISPRSIPGVGSELSLCCFGSYDHVLLTWTSSCPFHLDCSFVNGYHTVTCRYKRIFSIGTKGITTYNPSNLEVTNQVMNSLDTRYLLQVAARMHGTIPLMFPGVITQLQFAILWMRDCAVYFFFVHFLLLVLRSVAFFLCSELQKGK